MTSIEQLYWWMEKKYFLPSNFAILSVDKWLVFNFSLSVSPRSCHGCFEAFDLVLLLHCRVNNYRNGEEHFAPSLTALKNESAREL